MEYFIKDFIFIGSVIVFGTLWFLKEKDQTLKKYILLVCFLLVFAAVLYIVDLSLNLRFLSIFSLFAIIGAIIVFIRILMFQRKQRSR